MKKKFSLEKRLLILLPLAILLFIIFIHTSFPRKTVQADLSNTSIGNPPPTIDPSNFVTDAQSAITQAANGSLFNTSNQGTATFDFPNQFPDYYNWAKTNLFNGADYFTIASTGYQPIPGLTSFVKTANPTHINNGGQITYTITATYTGPGSVIISDTIPINTTLVGKPSGKYSQTGNTFNWRLSDNKNGTSQNYSFTFTVQAGTGANDTPITNTAYANLEGGQANGYNWLYSGSNLGTNVGGSQFVTADGTNHTDWVSAQCSGASMAEVFNYYGGYNGKKLNIADVLQYEQSISVWAPGQGLLNQGGVAQTATHFGYNADYQWYDPTEATLASFINQHRPIMYGTQTSFGVSHWMVLIDADSNWNADPAGAHLHTLDASSDFDTFDPKYPDNFLGKSLTNKALSENTFLARWKAAAAANGQGKVAGVVITPK